MTDLERRALARLPLTKDEVEAIDQDNADPATVPRLRFPRTIRNLCESHERLRAELQGVETLLEDADRRHKEECANLQHKIDLAKQAGDDAAEELDAVMAEAQAVLNLLDELGGVWSGMAIIDACRERLRKLTTKGE